MYKFIANSRLRWNKKNPWCWIFFSLEQYDTQLAYLKPPFSITFPFLSKCWLNTRYFLITTCWSADRTLQSQGGTPDFKWWRWWKFFGGFDIFLLGFFFWKKNLTSIDLSRDFQGIRNNLKIHGSEMFKAWKSDMGFWGGLIFGPGIFGVLLEALQKFLGFDFCPLSIIPVAWNPEYPLGAPIAPGYQTLVKSN